ncbi:hypothetical protein [Brevibacillus migulae]|uniref:hypothetical protein n=1 Tax=Brevibacillus migulae TaxID=1644114 RepID=UPI00106EE832|nr:hypothetical protein [Brevibacillus migulae]
MIIEATNWQAQLKDGSRLRGGQSNLMYYDVNVGAVPIDQMIIFSVGHNTGCFTYYVPTKTWYYDGKVTDFAYQKQFSMYDGSILTVDIDKETGLLNLTQAFPE